MRCNKLKAFTMAEVMILLLTLSVLMAAFAPIMTKRRINISSDDVWAYVNADNEKNAYFNAEDPKDPAQAFIGMTPNNENVTTTAINNLYSKLVIRTTDSLKNNKRQNHISFRYKNGNERGEKVGGLFAGNKNFLLGADYKNLQLDAVSDLASGNTPQKAYANTAYGVNALAGLQKGQYNTAVGTNVMKSVNDGLYNTAVGVDIGGENFSTGKYNTLVGYQAGFKNNGDSNVYIGAKAGGAPVYDDTSGNTAIGAQALFNFSSGVGNTAVGRDTMINLNHGNYNTAVGASSMSSLSSESSFNTSFGYNACNLLTGKTSNKTCIGASSGTTISAVIRPNAGLYLNDETERVYIGSMPSNATNGGAMAVLEVHNSKGDNVRNPSSLPIGEMGNESVVIHGNLIVRGQTFLETPIIRQRTLEKSDQRTNGNYPKGLIGYGFYSYAGNNYFIGHDGAKRVYDDEFADYQYNIVRKDCICTHSFRQDIGGTYPGSISTDYNYYTYTGASQSYDWTSTRVSTPCGNGYIDKSTGVCVKMVNNPGDLDSSGNYSVLEVDRSLAHPASGYSCCPNLISDVRLKNVKNEYTAGLEELKRLNFYNFTFKKDKTKSPHVGVIAQDLKLVFPNSVTKDKKGYYKIRWDEMFYALINSVKTIHARFENLSVKISNDKQRVNNLKSSNAKLNAKLDKLEQELAELE